MDRRKVRVYERRARDIWKTFHQSSLRVACELEELAYDAAAANDDDAPAAEQLRRAVGQKPERAIKYWLELLEGHRETRTGDRAFRIAAAAVTNRAVQPVEPTRVELFTRVDEMESVPIADAFARLVKLLPELGELSKTLQPLPEGKQDRLRWEMQLSKRLRWLVGPWIEHPDPLVRTAAMATLARDFLRIAAGDTALGTLETAHREVRRRRTKQMEADGWRVEPLSGGRVRFSKGSTLMSRRKKSQDDREMGGGAR
jgi:hypothetical protein